MTQKEQYALKLMILGYSNDEINFITNEAWFKCLDICKGNISYSFYMEKWTASKTQVVIIRIPNDRFAFILIDSIMEMVSPLKLVKKTR